MGGLARIAGIAYRDDYGVVHRTPPREPLPLDDIPVDVTLLPDEWMQLSTIRGCPYRCEHCVEHTTQGKVRWLSAEKLVWIMEERMRVTGNNNFFFQDDTFLAAKGRLKRMHEIMGKKGLYGKAKIHLISMNANLVDEGTIPMLKDIGAAQIGFGAESWNARVFKALKRGVVTQEDLFRVLDYAEKADMLPVGGSFAGGFPSETREELQDSIDRARSLNDEGKILAWGCFVVQALPGSRMWDRLYAEGKVSLDMDFSTLRIDADIAHFGTPWAYWNDDVVPRDEFIDIMKASGFARKVQFK